MPMPEGNEAENAPFERPSICLLGGLVGPAFLYGRWMCDHCKNVVQAEVVAKRRQIMKEGGGPLGCRVSKALGFLSGWGHQ